MKRFYFLFSVLLVGIFVYMIVSWTPGNDHDGIKFFEGTWQQTLAKARQENKPIFMDIYATWCGPCKMLKRKTFTNSEVGAYFNSAFVNVSFNGEKGEGVMLADKFGITGYPTLIVLNSNGEVLKMETGYLAANDLLLFAKQPAGR